MTPTSRPRVVPTSTYRVQLRPPSADHPGFTFDDAVGVVPYLAELGVTHLYCSPYLQAAPGSAHGYDVVDPTRLNAELGGEQAHGRLVQACRDAGLGIVLDVVPNHVAISEPESQNPAWWSLLTLGRSSPYAAWFDVDWDSPVCPGKVMVPILGAPLEEVLDELSVDRDRIRYYDHELPLAPGTLVEGDLAATLKGQHYALAHWKQAATGLNYRRFFDVTTLAGVRVEDPDVFTATHQLVLGQVERGELDGLRIDHPDGLADPGGYLDRLAEQSQDAWVVVEKILEPGEELPEHWKCAGTTGYDVLNDVLGLFVDPAGERPLTDHWQATTGSTASYADVVEETKHLVLDEVLAAEVERLTDVAMRATGQALERERLRGALVELLAAFDVYRAYVPPAGPADDVARARVSEAAAHAAKSAPHLASELHQLTALALAESQTGVDAREFVTRFQQTCGPVMAKGVEDTAFYRYARLLALNEVGGDPSRFGLSVPDFHDITVRRQQTWPLSMTTLSTHDTKRSEDVRARLVLLSQDAAGWVSAVSQWSALAEQHRGSSGPDAATEQLIWQTLAGAWPLPADRALAYLTKACREAKQRTSWLSPDEGFESGVERFVRGVLADDRVTSAIEAYVGGLEPAWRATVLAQKLVQLTAPGVADTYQGTEGVDLSLVDPDNRRPVDWDRRRQLLATPDGSLDSHKMHVVRTALTLRKEHPEWFVSGASYSPLVSGPRSIAYCRSDQVVVVAPVRALATCAQGWDDESVRLPDGSWRNLLTQGDHAADVPLNELLSSFPVALLVRS